MGLTTAMKNLKTNESFDEGSAKSKITRDDVLSAAEDNCLLLSKYRLRLKKASEIPFFRDSPYFAGKEFLVIDSPPNSRLSENVVSDAGEMRSVLADVTNNDSADFSGSPLKFNFLTLSQLRKAGKKVVGIPSEGFGTESLFPCSPVRAADAATAILRLDDEGWPLDEKSLGNVVTLFMTDRSDALKTVMRGVRHCESSTEGYLVRAFGQGNSLSQRTLEILNMQTKAFSKYEGRRSTARCSFNILSETVNEERHHPERISGSVAISVSWPLKHEAFLSLPPLTAPLTFHVSPGWLDGRLPLLTLNVELRFILALGRALRTNSMDWSCAMNYMTEDQIVTAIDELLYTGKGRTAADVCKDSEFRDFTEELWLILRNCQSTDSLKNSLKRIFDALVTGYRNTALHPDNHCTMARLLRDAASGNLTLPRLDSHVPFEIFIELGMEYVRRSIYHSFISYGFLPSVAEIDMYFKTEGQNTPEDRADQLFLLFNVLQVMKACGLYLRLSGVQSALISRRVLAKFAAIQISPTKEGLTKELLNSVGLSYDVRVTLGEVSPNTLRFLKPRLWTAETVYLNDREIHAIRLIHFSKDREVGCIPAGDFLKISETDSENSLSLTDCGAKMNLDVNKSMECDGVPSRLDGTQEATGQVLNENNSALAEGDYDGTTTGDSDSFSYYCSTLSPEDYYCTFLSCIITKHF